MNNNIFSKEFLYAVKEAGGVAQVACSYYTTWVLLNNGDLYGCGRGNEGQQGNGSTLNVTTLVKRASNVKQVACDKTGYATWYIDNDGDLYGCGAGWEGGQGSGSYSNVTTFTKRLSDVARVICSHTTTSSAACKVMALKTNGDLYAWGGNFPYYYQIYKYASNVKDMALSGYSNWYIDNSGNLYGMGNSNYGQLGNGSTSTVSSFTHMASNVVKVACSDLTTWYLNESSELYGTGRNDYGQQGTNSGSDVLYFTLRWYNVTDIFCSDMTTWFIDNDNDGYLYGCGKGSEGQQGNYGSTSNVTSFTARRAYTAKVACSSYTTWQLNTSGDLYGCGSGYGGQQSNGSTSDVTSFTKRASNVKDVFCSWSSTFYIDKNNDIYGCGSSDNGKQGNGSTNNVTTFQNKMQYLSEEIFIRVSNSNGYNFNLTVNGSTYTVGGSLSIPILANKDYSATIAGNAYATNINSASITYSGGTQSVSITSPQSSNSFTFPASTSDITLTVNTSYAGCVLYNTNILLADGTTKQAKDISVGDILQTYNEDTKTFESNKVLEVIPNKKDDIIKVTFNDDSFIELTSGHPFLTQKGWASYDNDKTIKEKLYNGAKLYQLEIGDKCLAQDNTFKTITSIEYENMGIVDVYDYTIENAHTFIGNNKVLHNVTSGGG